MTPLAYNIMWRIIKAHAAKLKKVRIWLYALAATERCLGPRARLRAVLTELVGRTLDACSEALQAKLLAVAEAVASALLGPKHLERHPLLFLGLKNRSHKLASRMARGEGVAPGALA